MAKEVRDETVEKEVTEDATGADDGKDTGAGTVGTSKEGADEVKTGVGSAEVEVGLEEGAGSTVTAAAANSASASAAVAVAATTAPTPKD
jgi:hypothetical protein